MKNNPNYKIVFRRVKPEDKKFFNSFNCGNNALNAFLKEECLLTTKDVTYIFYNKENNDIIGFGAICCSGISVEEEYKNIIYSTLKSAVEIDFFAIDEKYQHISYNNDTKQKFTKISSESPLL